MQQYEQGFHPKLEPIIDSISEDKIKELQDQLVTMKLKWKEKKKQMRINQLEVIDGIVELKAKIPLPYANVLKECHNM